jgi:16S rRNA (guanine(966)-N(2))-methyltransferase RsmD
MKTQIRIVAGNLRGRKVTCDVHPRMRPTPQMVREALFSILGDAVPGRPFFDVFAGTGVIGLEALSRGASNVTFVERNFRLTDAIDKNLREFGVADQARVARSDVYRWIEHWQPPAEAVTVFISPPFADFERRPVELRTVISELRQRPAPGSVVVLQAEESEFLDSLQGRNEADERKYGRNRLLFWVKGTTELPRNAFQSRKATSVSPPVVPVPTSKGRQGD